MYVCDDKFPFFLPVKTRKVCAVHNNDSANNKTTSKPAAVMVHLHTGIMHVIGWYEFVEQFNNM